LSSFADATGTNPTATGVYVDVAAAPDGDHVSPREAVTVSRIAAMPSADDRFDDERGVVEDHPHTGGDGQD
jgi:hypothetical protein